ncbi:MAG: hypothetical protein P1V97_12040 [Planctomycetota bacterium]|nr:hypothetical protein [Planctomycetota bacterium]
MNESLRCPYCRSELPRQSLEVASCLRCSTRHHKHCVAAHGACTILGCEARVVLLGGKRFNLDELAGQLDLGAIPFRVHDGLPEQEPRFLRVEDAIDDSGKGGRARVELVLKQSSVKRGQRVRGSVIVNTPKALIVQRAGLSLETRVETQLASTHSRRATRRKTKVIQREVVFAGQRRGNAGARLVDGVYKMLGKASDRLMTIPAGRREYPFSFHIDLAFAASVHHSHGGEEDHVETELTARVVIPFGQDLTDRQALTIL